MDELAAHTGIQRMGDWGGIVQYGKGDSSMVVMFYLKPVPNPAKSDAAGRPVFDDVIYVRIHPPGERLNIVDRRASDQDKKRFPMQFMQFKENMPQESSGTPIDMLFPSQPSIAAALKASGVHTVEQCSELSAHAIESIGMGCQHWVNTATRYLQVANKGVKASELRAALDERDRENASLKHKMDLMQAELTHLRENANHAVTMADVQQLLANQGGGGNRGVFPPGTPNKNYDAQAAQINNTHITRDLAKGKVAAKSAPAKRERVRAR